MDLLKTLVAVVALVLAGCSQGTGARAEPELEPEVGPEPEPVSMIVTTSLAACLKTRECIKPTVVQKVGNETLYQITLKEGNAALQYFYTDRDRFGVTFKVSVANQLLMEDYDLDGKVDKVSQTKEGVSGVKVYGPKSPLYPAAQRAYSHAMKIAEESIVPQGLLKFMRDAEEKRRKNST